MMLIIKRLFLCMVVLGSSLLQGMNRYIPVAPQKRVAKISPGQYEELQNKNDELLETSREQRLEIEKLKKIVKLQTGAFDHLGELNKLVDQQRVLAQKEFEIEKSQIGAIERSNKRRQKERELSAYEEKRQADEEKRQAEFKLYYAELKRQNKIRQAEIQRQNKISAQRVRNFRIFGFPPLAALTGGTIAESHNPGITASAARRFVQGASSIRPSFGMPSFASGRFTSGLSTGSFRMPSFGMPAFITSSPGVGSLGVSQLGSGARSVVRSIGSWVTEIAPFAVPVAAVEIFGVTAYDAFCDRNANDIGAVERARTRKWFYGLSAGLGLMSLYLNRENLGNGLDCAVENHPDAVINTGYVVAAVAGTAAVGAAGYGVKKCVDVVRGFNPFRFQNNLQLAPQAPQAQAPQAQAALAQAQAQAALAQAQAAGETEIAIGESLSKLVGRSLNHNQQTDGQPKFDEAAIEKILNSARPSAS